MKRIKIIALALLSALVAYAGEVTVNGTVNGKNFYQSVNLYLINNDFVTTTPVLPDGKFTLKCDIAAAESYYLLFTGDNGLRRQVLAFLTPGDEIDITFESTYADIRITDVKGSADMVLIKKYYDKTALFQTDMQALQAEYDKAEAVDRQAVQQKVYARYNVYAADLEKLLLASKTLPASMLIEYAEFSKDFGKHKGTFKTIYTALQPKYESTLVMKEVSYKVTNPIEVGNAAPELEGVTPDGKTIKLSDLKGKYVLVDFWASWCRPCRAENPNVVEAYNKYHKKGFEVFSVSLDADATAWKSAIEADGLVWKNHVCTFKRWSCPLAKSYRVNSIPFSVLVGPDGKIVSVKLRGEELQNVLRGIFE